MSEFMFIRVCVWFIYKYIYSYIYISLSLYVCVHLSSLAESAQTDIIFTLLSELLLFFFFFPLTYIYRQKTRAFPTVCSLSICLSLTLERKRRKRSQNKNAHSSQAEWLLF